MLTLAISANSAALSYTAIGSQDLADACLAILLSVPAILARHSGVFTAHLRLAPVGRSTQEWDFTLDAGRSRADTVTALLPHLQRAAPYAIWVAEALLADPGMPPCAAPRMMSVT